MSNESTVSDTVNENEQKQKDQEEIDNVLDEVVNKANKTFYQEGIDGAESLFQIKIDK